MWFVLVILFLLLLLALVSGPAGIPTWGMLVTAATLLV